MLQAPSLATLARIRHGFFTRAGGVSQGVYATLNGGVGSNDGPDTVAENRVRMASALGVTPDRLLPPHPIYSPPAGGVPPDPLLPPYKFHPPAVVVAAQPWTQPNPPRADAVVPRVARLVIGVS